MATRTGADALDPVAQPPRGGLRLATGNRFGVVSVFNNSVPTVWVFLALGVVLALVFVKLLFINRRRPRQPGDIDSWSG